MSIALSWPLGKLEQKRTAITLVNNASLTTRTVVPANAEWLVYLITVFNGDDVNRNCLVTIVDPAHNRLHELGYSAVVASNYVGFPLDETLGDGAPTYKIGKIPVPFLVKGGNKIEIAFAAGGVSTGGTGYYMLTYKEFGK